GIRDKLVTGVQTCALPISDDGQRPGRLHVRVGEGPAGQFGVLQACGDHNGSSRRKGEAVAVVETVRGPVDLGNLGQTLMHEHVYVLSTEHVQNYGSDWWDEEAMVARAIDKLNAVSAKGISTIVDPTVWGLGRDIPRTQRIAAQTPVNIVVATGLYVYEELPQQYAYRGPGLLIDMPEPMVTDFSRDITEGIAGTGVKAAFLKFALETPEP